MPKLKYTENDVEDFAKVLEGGGKYRRVVVMTEKRAAEDPGLRPNADNIVDQLKSLLEDCRSATPCWSVFPVMACA